MKDHRDRNLAGRSMANRDFSWLSPIAGLCNIDLTGANLTRASLRLPNQRLSIYENNFTGANLSFADAS